MIWRGRKDRVHYCIVMDASLLDRFPLGLAHDALRQEVDQSSIGSLAW